MSLAENIKKYRTENKMSQEDLAEALGVTRQSVSKWETEKGNPDTDKLIQMSQLFDISLGKLTDTEQKENHKPAANRELTTAQELTKYKKQAKMWKGIAIGILIVILICGMTGIFVIHKVYPQFWDKVFSHYQTNRDKKSTELKHDNLYEDGIDGLLTDLEKVIDFPQHLMLKNSFNLHFAPDGTIASIDTMWYGYDERYTYVDSYLITYDRSKSSKIDVYFHGGTGDVYDKEKDVNVLFDALRVIPLADSVRGWQEAEYGILYKGIRDWGYNTEGIIYIDKEKRMDIPSGISYFKVQGPTVSVYCPNNESITPKRYIYSANNLEEGNIK